MATITGTGSPQATVATSSGAGNREITGTGAGTAGTAVSAGYVNEQGEGNLIAFIQEVVLKGSGNLIDFEQSIQSADESGTLVLFEQVVKSGSGKFKGLLII